MLQCWFSEHRKPGLSPLEVSVLSTVQHQSWVPGGQHLAWGLQQIMLLWRVKQVLPGSWIPPLSLLLAGILDLQYYCWSSVCFLSQENCMYVTVSLAWGLCFGFWFFVGLSSMGLWWLCEFLFYWKGQIRKVSAGADHPNFSVVSFLGFVSFLKITTCPKFPGGKHYPLLEGQLFPRAY